MDEKIETQMQEKRSPRPRQPSRGQLWARIHYGVLAGVYLVLFIVALVALGTFAAKEAEVSNFASRIPGLENSCILYPTVTSEVVIAGFTVRLIKLGESSACGFVLWGQASLLIVLFVWLVYNIVLIVLARNIVSAWRIIDAVVMGISAVVFLISSAVLHDGVNKACSTILGSTPGDCSGAYIQEITPSRTLGERVFFYDSLQSSRTSSWILTVSLILLTVWYAVLVVLFILKCCSGNSKKHTKTPSAV